MSLELLNEKVTEDSLLDTVLEMYQKTESENKSLRLQNESLKLEILMMIQLINLYKNLGVIA